MKSSYAIYLLSLFLYFCFVSQLFAHDKCECSGIFPSTTSVLWQQIRSFIEVSNEPSIGDVITLIVPSSRLVFSGAALGSAYSSASQRNPDRIVIIVKSSEVDGIGISTVPSFRTPLGTVYSDVGIVNSLLANYPDVFKSVSICPPDGFWIQLPFIKYIWQNVQVVPILVGGVGRDKIEQASQILSSLPGELLVVGVSCFEPVGGEGETPLPSVSMAHLLSLDVNGFLDDVHKGIIVPESPLAVALAMSIAKKFGAENGVLLRRMVSVGIESGIPTNLVSLAFVSSFTKSAKPTALLDQSLGKELLDIAEQSILASVESKPYVVSAKKSFPSGLGVFVSLNRNDSVLACAGELFLTLPVDVSTAKFAQILVKSKSRLFKIEHLDGSEIVVNVAEPVMSLTHERESVGIYVRHGDKVGVLFPDEEKESSLSARLGFACLRAGLFSDCWRNPGVEIRYFKVQRFSRRLTR